MATLECIKEWKESELQIKLNILNTVLRTVPGPITCTMLEHSTEHSHLLNKLDFGGQTCLVTVRIA